MTRRIVRLDSYKGSARELLRLLQSLHAGETLVQGLSRLSAIDAVCEALCDARTNGGES